MSVLVVVLGLGVGGASGSGSGLSESAQPLIAFQPVVADFNGDGRSDVAFIASYLGGVESVYVRLGDGKGRVFDAPGSPIDVPQSPEGIAVGDFNGDHRPDIVVVSTLGKAELLLGDGRGGFQQAPGPQLTVASPGAVVAGDFNGDGHFDFVVSRSTGQDQLLFQTFFGDGQGGFSAGPTTVGSVPAGPHGYGQSNPLASGDFNGDGHLDLAFAYGPVNDCLPPPGCGPQPEAALDVLLGNGHGGFNEAPGSPYPGGGQLYEDAFNPVVGDFNGDGYSDIAQDTFAGNTSGPPAVRVLLGGPSGRLTSAPGSPFAMPSPGSLASADVNRDGHLDLVSASGQPGYSVLLGNGKGAFRVVPGSPWPLKIGMDTGSALADFNGDGRPDLAVADKAGGIFRSGLVILLAGHAVAQLTLPATRVRAGKAVRLSAKAVESGKFMKPTITDYRWDLGSGRFTVNSHTRPSIRVRFHRVGVHKIRLKVTDSAGHKATTVKRLKVVPPRTGRYGP